MSATTLPISQSLLLKGLNAPNFIEMVYGSDYGYNVMGQLVAQLGPSKSVNTPRFEVPALGYLGVYSQVTAASTTDSNGNLVVTVADPSNFRVGDMVADRNLVEGRVVSKTSTTITLAAHAGVTWATGTHFTSGMIAKSGYNASDNRDSRGLTALNYTPDYDWGVCAVTRESGKQARRDRTASKVMWKGNFWYRSWDDLVLKNFSKKNEFKYAFSQRHDGGDGGYSTTGGLRWSIKENGGKYMPLTSEFTKDDLNDFLYTMHTATANGGRRLVALMGAAFMARLQTIFDDYIKYSGQQNTFGGVAVKGLNIMEYTYLGMSISFVHWPMLDDPMFQGEASTINGKNMRSYSAYFMDLTPIDLADGTGTAPVIQRYHFNNDELLANYVSGFIGLNDSDPGSVKQAIASGVGASFAANDTDNVEFHILTDSGLYVRPEKLGLMEAIV